MLLLLLAVVQAVQHRAATDEQRRAKYTNVLHVAKTRLTPTGRLNGSFDVLTTAGTGELRAPGVPLKAKMSPSLVGFTSRTVWLCFRMLEGTHWSQRMSETSQHPSQNFTGALLSLLIGSIQASAERWDWGTTGILQIVIVRRLIALYETPNPASPSVSYSAGASRILS